MSHIPVNTVGPLNKGHCGTTLMSHIPVNTVGPLNRGHCGATLMSHIPCTSTYMYIHTHSGVQCTACHVHTIGIICYDIVSYC